MTHNSTAVKTNKNIFQNHALRIFFFKFSPIIPMSAIKSTATKTMYIVQFPSLHLNKTLNTKIIKKKKVYNCIALIMALPRLYDLGIRSDVKFQGRLMQISIVPYKRMLNERVFKCTAFSQNRIFYNGVIHLRIM